MKFSQRSTLSAIATVTALFGQSQAVGDCDGGGPWNSNPVGYETGGEWCATKWKDGAAINGIQGWANGDSVNGIEFQFTNGVAPERHGQMTGDKKEWLTWDTTTDTVESITMWPNGRSDVRRVAAIEIKISNRDPWRIGTVPPNTQGYDSPVVKGAGIIMGAYGRQGGSIDALGFLMMDSAIKNRDVKDFAPNGDSLNANNEALKNQKPEAIDSFAQENWTGEKMTYQVDRRIEKTRSWSTTRTSSKTFGGSVGASIDFGLPAIGLGGSVSTEFHWETTNTYENTEAGSDTTELFFSVSGKIPKGEAIYCEALAFSAKYDLDYGSTIELELQSGKVWSYHEVGTVKGVAWSKNENKCISYKKGENGAEVLEKKLAEWKEDPKKEEQENQEREQRAEESEKEPTSTAEVSASATDSSTPSETEEATTSKTMKATPSKTEEATPSETEEATPSETEEATPSETEEPTPSETDEATTSKTKKPTPSKTADATPSVTDKATSTKTDESQPTGTGEPDEEEEEEEEPSDEEEEEEEEPSDEEEEEEPSDEEEEEEPSDEEEEQPVDEEEEPVDEEEEEPADEEEEEPADEEEETTDEEESTETVESSATTEASAEATLDATFGLSEPSATEEPIPTTTSKARHSTTSRAHHTTRGRASNERRAQITPAPTVLDGKRSLTFTA